MIRQQVRLAVPDLYGRVFITEPIQDFRDVTGLGTDVNDRRAHGQDVVNFARVTRPSMASPITTTCASAAESDAANWFNG